MKHLIGVVCAIALNGQAGDWLVEKDKWQETVSCGDMLSLSFGEKYRGESSLVVSNCVKRSGDTAWRIQSLRQPVPKESRYLCTSFRAASDWVIRQTYTTPGWCNAISWYDAEGKRIDRKVRSSMTIGRQFSQIAYTDEVPENAASYTVEFGFDTPNVPPDKRLALNGLNMTFSKEKPKKVQTVPPDLCEPEVRFTPPRQEDEGFSVTITDTQSEIKWSEIKISVDGVDATKSAKRQKNVISLPRPDKPWGDGLHKVSVEATDAADNQAHSVKYFQMGPQTATSPICRLRKDGMMILDGQPFFPIGIYGVCRREFNGNDFDRGCADLKAGGFNIVQSYSDNDNPEFYAAARKHGLKTWSDYRTPEDETFKKILRDETSCVARYTGDDTSTYFSPSVMIDRHESAKAVSPWRLTCQADWTINQKEKRSRYREYVSATDVFMPEIYPVRSDERDSESNCVAIVVRDMDQACRDIAEAKDTSNHALWPIIQYFQGWTNWKRFPTREELFAMSFAAIVHGANGIILYTYGGHVIPKNNTFDYGVTTTPERWTNTTNLATRISSIAPVLMSETGGRCDPVVTSGPKKDGLGQPSVTAIWKKHGKHIYIVAVNGTREKVSATFAWFKNAAGEEAQVAWEGRKIEIDGNGIRDDFKPYDVHVYRLTSRKMENR